MDKFYGYIALIVICVLILLFARSAWINQGKVENDNMWRMKFITAIPDTVLRIDTIFAKPESLKVKPKTMKAKPPVELLPGNPCEDVETIFVDTSGGEHNITYHLGELSEVFLAPNRPILERTISKNIPVDKIIEVRPGWLFGLSGELDRESHQGIGLGLILGRNPLYVSTRYYFGTKSVSYGIGIFVTF